MMMYLEDSLVLVTEQLTVTFTDVQKVEKRAKNANLPRFMSPGHFIPFEKVMIVCTKDTRVNERFFMKMYTVKNWNEFQHYAKRSPPWIKLHRVILDDYIFCSMTDEQKAHLMLIWIYASQNNGVVPFDELFLERKLTISNLDLTVFIERGFLIEKVC